LLHKLGNVPDATKDRQSLKIEESMERAQR